jgi:hypothetical protein
MWEIPVVVCSLLSARHVVERGMQLVLENPNVVAVVDVDGSDDYDSLCCEYLIDDAEVLVANKSRAGFNAKIKGLPIEQVEGGFGERKAPPV